MPRKSRTQNAGAAQVFVVVCVFAVLGWFARNPMPSDTVRINEVLVDNRFTSLDGDDNASPWVELVNTGTRPVNIFGFSLTNDVTVPHKWRLPAREVPPGGYLLVWLSGKGGPPQAAPPQAREIHASFDLSRRGETLMLVAPDGSTSDALFLPPQSEDHSYGRFPDGSGEYHYLLFPTPEGKNREPIAERPFLPRPRIHPEGGRYDQRIAVEMTMPLPVDDVEIRYTTDATRPTPDSLLYAQPVVLNPAPTGANRVLRAATFYRGERVSQIESHSYLLDGESFGLPLLSILMDPLDFKKVQLDSDARGLNAEHPGFIEVVDASGARAVGSGVGVRLHGFSGRHGGFDTKKSYRLYFRDLYGKGKLRHPIVRDEGVAVKRIVLRANNDDAFRRYARASYIRDQLVRELHEEMGYVASHGAWYSVLVNFDFKGVYNAVERIDRHFLSSHIDGDVPAWDIVHDGNNVEGSLYEWTRLTEFMRENDLAADARYAEAQKLIDVVNFTDYMILNIWAQNHDWPHKNYFAARPRVPEGKWTFLSWDAENTLGLHRLAYDLNTFERAFRRGGALSETFSALMRNRQYQELFVERFEHHMSGALEPKRVATHVRTLADAIAPDQEREIRNQFSEIHVAAWRNNIEKLVQFALERPVAIRRHIFGSGRLSVARAGESPPSESHAP